MRYKANIHPSYLLCPLRHTWHPIEKCIPKLDNAKYCTFDESECSRDNDDALMKKLIEEKVIIL